MQSVGVLGASGYAGAELLRLVAGHPQLDVVYATADRHAGEAVGCLYPGTAAAYGDLTFTQHQPGGADGLDLVFSALPHGESQTLMADLRRGVTRVVDLAADFRLTDPAVYAQWYGSTHRCPELVEEFTYGLPELHRDPLVGATAIAAAGCYPTAAALALAPLVTAGLIERSGIVVDAASGVSGAGRGLRDDTSFCAVDEDFTAYGLGDHRHTPEIEQAVGAEVLFTPHLAPMNRGILATCYARASAPLAEGAVLDALHAAYANEPFIVVDERPPSTKATLGSNAAHLTGRYDARTGWVMALCAIDNLGKGAAGQAVQCANIASGLPETMGLSALGVTP